jgi:hypothetical protein
MPAKVPASRFIELDDESGNDEGYDDERTSVIPFAADPRAGHRATAAWPFR